MGKIAILVDSCTDVPKQYMEQYGMYVLPLLIHYENEEYRDKIDITAEEVYNRLETEIPKTSLPSLGVIQHTIEQIIQDGCQQIIAITISSGLSGTYNAIRIMAEQFTDVEIFVLDTKNIGLGAGFAAISAGEWIAKGETFDVIISKLQMGLADTKVFFSVNTLEYLKKGGRIGTVSYVLGTALNLRPIISCNKEGVYYTVKMARGKQHPWHKALEAAISFAQQFDAYNIAIVHGQAEREAEELYEAAKAAFSKAKLILKGQIGPALGVHTGPGLVGIGIQKVIFE